MQYIYLGQTKRKNIVVAHHTDLSKNFVDYRFSTDSPEVVNAYLTGVVFGKGNNLLRVFNGIPPRIKEASFREYNGGPSKLTTKTLEVVVQNLVRVDDIDTSQHLFNIPSCSEDEL